MDHKVACGVVLVCCLLACVNSYRILGIFPHPGKSHVDVFVPLMRGLAQKGHQVTVISRFPLKSPSENYTDIALEHPENLRIDSVSLDSVLWGTRPAKWLTFLMLDIFGKMVCQHATESKVLEEFLKTHGKFDVVITEFFNSDCYLGLVSKLNVPFIGLSSCSLMPWNSERMGNPTHPAYIVDNFLGFSDKMNFLERVENTVFSFYHNVHFNEIVLRRDDKYARTIFGDDIPYLRDFVRNASLLLVNTHFTLNLPRPFVPAVVEIGGIHIGKPKPLSTVSVFYQDLLSIKTSLHFKTFYS